MSKNVDAIILEGGDSERIRLVGITPIYGPPEVYIEHDDGTVTFRSTRPALGRDHCPAGPVGRDNWPDHGWQSWDSRYRRCRFCGEVERVEA